MFEAFQFGPVTLWMRTAFLLLAIVLSTEFFFRLARSAGLSIQSIKDVALWHLLSFLFFGRLFAVLANYQIYLKNVVQVFIVWDGAFSFIGGAIGIGIVLFVMTHLQRATFLQWLDVLLPATTFGLAFDWLGMFLAAQSYGKPTNVLWAVTFDTFNVRYTVPIHPIQLYYVFFYFALTFALLLVRRYSSRAGAETLFGIILMTTGVFFFEFLRGDFGIPVFARLTDFIFLAGLFLSLGILALIEQRLSERVNAIYGISVAVLTVSYILTRSWFDLPQFQLRFSQVLAVLALIATVVYVVVHRRKYPHL
jgi:phosphatidylglycerol:prolipoprotein diacylglycerol transferase